MEQRPYDDSRVLVTGGAGFIGSALIWGLNRLGCERITVADFLGTTEKWRNLVPLRFADYLEADDLEEAVAEDALGAFDYVFHLGACSSTTERDAEYLLRNNYAFAQALAAWALALGARFIFASSAATYGDGSRGMADGSDGLDRLRPLNMYGYSKHLFDLWAWRQGLLEQLIGLKYFNVFGPNEDHKDDMRSMVHRAHGQIRETGVIRLFKSYRDDYADGEQRRDFLYVKDAVAMTLHLGRAPGAGGLYNIGSGRARTWLDLARAVFAALGQEPRIEFIEMPAALRDKYQYFTQADIGRLRAAGYDREITSLEAAVDDYVRVYLAADRRLGDEE